MDKFIFGDKVKIVSGFYFGFEGTVVEENNYDCKDYLVECRRLIDSCLVYQTIAVKLEELVKI